MKKVLIIGCGYLGSHLANFFNYHSWKVKIAGRHSAYVTNLTSGIEFYEMNITDNDQLSSIIEQDDVVIYATGSINATNAFCDISEDINKYYQSFIRLLNDCSRMRINKFVFLSSAGTVYGDVDSYSGENNSLNPINIYGLQKVFFENLIKIKHYESNQLPFLILRVSNPYGRFQDPKKNQGIIPILIKKAINKEDFIFWGNVDALRDFIFMDDFLTASYLSITTQIMETINIASGISTSIKQVIDIVEEETNSKINIVYKESQNKTVMNNLLDIDKLKKLTGYTPVTSLNEGILSMIKERNVKNN